MGSAIGRPASAASAACCTSASDRASSAQRARRSARSDHPPLTHSGRRCPSGATGSSSSPSSVPVIPNRSSGPPAGIVSVASPRALAQAQPGSARQPPNSSRCAAVMSQHVASRTPSATRCAAVWPDHTAHRGRSTSSARSTSAASPGAASPRTFRGGQAEPAAGEDDQPHEVAAGHPGLAQGRHEVHGPTFPWAADPARWDVVDPGVHHPKPEPKLCLKISSKSRSPEFAVPPGTVLAAGLVQSRKPGLVQAQADD